MIKKLAFSLLNRQPPLNGVHSKQGPYHRVFSIGGVDYFCYDSLGDLSAARAEQVEAFIELEAEFNINRGDLALLLQDCQQLLSADGGVSEVGKVQQILGELQKRLIMLPRLETIYKVAAAMFFSSSDDPGQALPLAEIDNRAAEFKKKGALIELLRTPLKDILSLEVLSTKDTRTSLNDLQKKIILHSVIYAYQDTLLKLSPGHGSTLEK